jgi:predicted HD phosphohydrolase
MGLLARRASLGEARARRQGEFLASIFQAATPEGSKGENVTARQLLDQAAGRIDTELASDPQLRAAMAENIGEAYVAPLLAANLPALHDYNHAALKHYLLARIATPPPQPQSRRTPADA